MWQCQSEVGFAWQLLACYGLNIHGGFLHSRKDGFV
jgi:hypothetical protein